MTPVPHIYRNRILSLGGSKHMEFDLRTDDLSATDLEDNFDKNDTSPEVQTLKKNVKRTSPTGKLIDIATNDLMKFQQGVFLLLSDFNLVNRLYLTKNVRNSFKITKYILSKGICADLVRMIAAETPWYRFSQLLEIKNGIQSAIKHNETNL